MAIIFYSWQSDLPNRTNRSFIETALINVAKRIQKDESIEVKPVIERDTQGLPGSPEIARSIFEKIEQSKVFVCDVSIINSEILKVVKEQNLVDVPRSRPMVNPNVLVELGYALKALGEQRIVLVMNTFFGDENDLPFDLRQRRVLKYEISNEVQERSEVRKNLERTLENTLRKTFETPFSYLEGTWEHLSRSMDRKKEGRRTEIKCIAHGKLEVATYTNDRRDWTGRIKMDQDMPEWGEGYYNYDHGNESGRQIIIVENPSLIRVFPIPLTHEKGSTRYYFWQKRDIEA